jgi:hypothetical protein
MSHSPVPTNQMLAHHARPGWTRNMKIPKHERGVAILCKEEAQRGEHWAPCSFSRRKSHCLVRAGDALIISKYSM